ncbi:unnamed protein product [Urochloa decumbens]|uniref:Uncharacterized protein n=1 Tax=Urochloa decumbens TaxID=240449 RepID=A0ABC8ZU72_9POAL
MDQVTQAVENLKKEWTRAVSQLGETIAAIESCGKTGKGTEEAISLPRLNASAQDVMQLLKSLQFRLDLLAQQLPTFELVQSGQETLQSWDEQEQKLRASLRNANLQAKENVRKAAQEERGLLLGGGEESTIRRRNLQTKAGMTSAAESITESLRRSRQMMVQLMPYRKQFIDINIHRKWKEVQVPWQHLMNQQVFSGRLKVNIEDTALCCCVPVACFP